jgi:hypothetical protein
MVSYAPNWVHAYKSAAGGTYVEVAGEEAPSYKKNNRLGRSTSAA